MNLGKFETRGVDFEASYRLPLQEVGDGLPGNLNFRLLTSLLYNMTIDNGLGSPPVNYAGQSGPTAAFGGFNTSPRWQSNFFTTYSNGPFTATLQAALDRAGQVRVDYCRRWLSGGSGQFGLFDRQPEQHQRQLRGLCHIREPVGFL